MLYVSVVRQFETLLFYVVTSRIEASVVSCHKFLNACVDKVYRLLLQPIVYCRFHLCSFRKCSFSVTIRCTVVRDTFGKNSARSVMLKRLFSRIFYLNLLYAIGIHDAGATAAFVVVHVILTTFKLPTPSSNQTVAHRSFSIDLKHLPVTIGWWDVLGL